MEKAQIVRKPPGEAPKVENKAVAPQESTADIISNTPDWAQVSQESMGNQAVIDSLQNTPVEASFSEKAPGFFDELMSFFGEDEAKKSDEAGLSGNQSSTDQSTNQQAAEETMSVLEGEAGLSGEQPEISGPQISQEEQDLMSLPDQEQSEEEAGLSGEQPEMSGPQISQEEQDLMSLPDQEQSEEEAGLSGEQQDDNDQLAENLAEAEFSRVMLEERMTGLGQLPAEDQDLILARVSGLEGAALVQEMEMIDRALASGNPDRALHTLAGIEEIIQEDPNNQERLTPEVVGMLVNSVGESRSESDRGQEGVMGARQARQSARTMLDMSETDYLATRDLLDQAGRDEAGNPIAGASAEREQSLILKAVASRNADLSLPGIEGVESDTQREIAHFAEQIRGTESDELMRQTTLLDIHDENTSTVNPDNINGPADTDSTNDGLYQRFADSCAPTTAQITRGELDPMYAWGIHNNEGVENADPHSFSGDEQNSILLAHGGDSQSRLGQQAQVQTTDSLNNLESAGTISPAQRTLVDRMMAGQVITPDQQANADQALEAVRLANNGHPTDMELQAVQENQGRGSTGVWIEDALSEGATDAAGYEWDLNHTNAANPVSNSMDDIEAHLVDGEDVPFQVNWDGGGAHAMTISDTRRDESGNRSFLVTDPWSGSTIWLTEAEFSSGDFQGHFDGLGNGEISRWYGAQPETP